MARPYSEGRLQYFPLDCVFNDAMKLLEAEFGLTAFAVVVKLWQKIYSGRGYYCEWTKEVALVFSREIGVGANVVSEILQSAFKRGIFDRDLFDKYSILTSDGIQKRYFEAVKRRKQILVDERFLLVPVAQNGVNACNNEVNVYNNEVNADINSQSKVNESRVNESILESKVVAKSDDMAQENIKNYLSHFPNLKITDEDIIFLLDIMGDEETVFYYVKRLSDFIQRRGAVIRSHCDTVLKWYKEDKKSIDGSFNQSAAPGRAKGEYEDIARINREYLLSLKDMEV